MDNTEKQKLKAELTDRFKSNPMRYGFWKSRSVCNDIFIMGDPRVNGAAYVFNRNTQTGIITHGSMVGVFDEYQRVSQVPNWVKKPLIETLLYDLTD